MSVIIKIGIWLGIITSVITIGGFISWIIKSLRKKPGVYNTERRPYPDYGDDEHKVKRLIHSDAYWGKGILKNFRNLVIESASLRHDEAGRRWIYAHGFFENFLTNKKKARTFKSLMLPILYEIRRRNIEEFKNLSLIIGVSDSDQAQFINLLNICGIFPNSMSFVIGVDNPETITTRSGLVFIFSLNDEETIKTELTEFKESKPDVDIVFLVSFIRNESFNLNSITEVLGTGTEIVCPFILKNEDG